MEGMGEGTGKLMLRRHDNEICIRRHDHTATGAVIGHADCRGRQVPAEYLGSARHARERLGVGGGLLRPLRRSADRRNYCGQRVVSCPCHSRRQFGKHISPHSVGSARLLRFRVRRTLHRLSSGEDANSCLLSPRRRIETFDPGRIQPLILRAQFTSQRSQCLRNGDN